MGEYLKLIQNAQNAFAFLAFDKLNKGGGIDHYDKDKGVYNINDTGKKIIGKSPHMITVFYLIEQAINKYTHVLLIGETGTGKELVAKALHYNSTRHRPLNNNYVIVNCSFHNKDLLSTELFGYSRGAFTSADPSGKIGAFEEAVDGTIVLDEIGDMTLDVQKTLLRVLEERRFHRLGRGKDIDLSNTRVIASTNKDLAELVRIGEFREDLFYRLEQTVICLPPLRERAGEDLKAIVEYFAGTSGFISDKILEEIKSTNFPGNFRGLENIILRGKSLGFDQITDEVLAILILYMKAQSYLLNGGSIGSNDLSIGQYGSEKDGHNGELPTLNVQELRDLALRRALEQTKGNKKKAARITGIDFRTINRIIKRETGS
ncbi:sigma-54-dependent Fis family transcriptional regulator [Candidatus Woesearchaeota archaeon]|nr:sigma-54-dependent Fis family transcriptional regulator [Candidatus Woesearchaeota archaeon]